MDFSTSFPYSEIQHKFRAISENFRDFRDLEIWFSAIEMLRKSVSGSRNSWNSAEIAKDSAEIMRKVPF